MKKNKTKRLISLITYFIEYLVAFSVADSIAVTWGIRHSKILSIGSALYIRIATTIVVTLDLLFSKINNKFNKSKNYNNE